MVYCDAHLHAAQCPASAPLAEGSLVCTCAHGREEFLRQEALSRERPGTFLAFGAHPQDPAPDLAFLATVLEEGRIHAVGEVGFDCFTEEFRARRARQKECWDAALTLALRYRMPAVVHDRKALDELFADSRRLSRLPAVVLHSFAFGPAEARSLLRHGMNAYFSFGKQLLNGNKKARACVRELPPERLLLETDAPFQTLRGEPFTAPAEIAAVYAEASRLRGIPPERLAADVERNFRAVFCPT